MAKCGDCLYFLFCKKFVDPEETFPEIGGCHTFTAKDAFVEVVRCKDCVHRGDDVHCPMCFEEVSVYDDGDGYMENDYITHDRTIDEGFCDRGEREN